MAGVARDDPAAPVSGRGALLRAADAAPWRASASDCWRRLLLPARWVGSADEGLVHPQKGLLTSSSFLLIILPSPLLITMHSVRHAYKNATVYVFFFCT